MLKNASTAEIDKILYFSQSGGLPTILPDLHIVNLDSEKLMMVTDLACGNSDR